MIGSEHKKIIAVFGATGSEGIAVIKAFNRLREGGNEKYLVRAVVASVHSAEAQFLKSHVDEMFDDYNMKRALSGAYGVYIANNYFSDMDIAREMKELNRIKEYCSSLDIKHVVLSCSEDTRSFGFKRSDIHYWQKTAPGGREPDMFCPPYDAKGAAADSFANAVPTTKLYPAFNLELLLSVMNPIEQVGQKYVLSLPVSRAIKIPVVSPQDIGAIACAIFQDPRRIGVTVGVKSDLLTGADMALQLSQAFNASVSFEHVTYEEFSSSGLPGAREIANMLRYIAYHDRYVLRRTQPPGLRTLMGIQDNFQSWVQAHFEELKEKFFGGELEDFNELAETGEVGHISYEGSVAKTAITGFDLGAGEVEWA